MSNTTDQFEEMEETQNFEDAEFQYWAKLFNEFPQSVISDEQYDRNKELLEQISDDFSDMNERDQNFPPTKARKVLEIVFSNIQKFGYR